jgi:hypothetical protein
VAPMELRMHLSCKTTPGFEVPILQPFLTYCEAPLTTF